MDDAPGDSAHDDDAGDDVRPCGVSAHAAGAARDYRGAVPLEMPHCLNKTHPTNCTRCAKA